MMYQAHNWWFPDQDTHFVEMLSKNISKGFQPVYQEPVRRRSLGYCKNKNLALDIGANVGLWSRDLCNQFGRVIAFEPVADFRECLIKNVPVANLEIQPCALGATEALINMIITPNNTGHSHIDPNSIGDGQIPMRTLDSFNLSRVDYIKIDCEGYENNILLGAKQTIINNHPIIVIEDKKHKDVGHTDTVGAVELLESWGATILNRVNNDVILGWI
jgi:FkbM family methyltransferase